MASISSRLHCKQVSLRKLVMHKLASIMKAGAAIVPIILMCTACLASNSMHTVYNPCVPYMLVGCHLQGMLVCGGSKGQRVGLVQSPANSKPHCLA